MPKHHLPAGIACSLLTFLIASPAAEPDGVIFHDNFDGKLADGWSWEREDQSAWRVGPAGLEVRVQPGNMWGGANNARNVLVRPIPTPTDAPVEISVTLSNAPTAQWEQANLVWFYDDSNMVKLGQELVTGRYSIVMGREENDRARTVAIIPLDDNTVELRLQAVNNRVRGQFRTRHWRDWRDVGECDLPVKGEPKASLHFYNGPADAAHWIMVNRFTVRHLKPEAANWPRVRVSENTCRLAGGGTAGSAIASLSLGDGMFVLANDARGVAGDAKANCEQKIFVHQDGSCGWSWDRRASSSKEPVQVGIGMGNFDPRYQDLRGFPLKGLWDFNKRTRFEMESDAVTRLENDQGSHDLAVEIWLTAAQTGWPATHQVHIDFDWYGKAATGQSLHDGYRDYEYVGTKTNRGLEVFQYRLRGFRGAPPKVNLGAFIADAVQRGLPNTVSILGVWFGNEVWDGSRGGTLVTKLDLLMDGKRYSSVPAHRE